MTTGQCEGNSPNTSRACPLAILVGGQSGDGGDTVTGPVSSPRRVFHSARMYDSIGNDRDIRYSRFCAKY